MNKEEADLIITEQNKSTEEILKAVAKVKSDYHELCKVKDMRIAELEAEVNRLKLNEQLAVNNGKNLLKENAELKIENAFCEKACEGAAMMYKDLCKAKEIIKEYMRSI